MSLTLDDRLDIHELLGLHGHLVDDRRPDDLAQLFTPDARYDVTAYGLGVVAGLGAIIELFHARPGNQPIGHHVTNVRIVESNADQTRVRSKGLGVMADGTAGTVVYDDIVTKTNRGWRISNRTVLPAGSEPVT